MVFEMRIQKISALCMNNLLQCRDFKFQFNGSKGLSNATAILVLSVYSSVFREMKKYQKDFSSWCGECQREKRERQIQSVKATKLVNRFRYKTQYTCLSQPPVIGFLDVCWFAFFRAGIS